MKTTIINTDHISLKDFRTRDSDAVIMDSLGREGVYRLFTIDETTRGFEINFKLFHRWGWTGLPKVRAHFIAELHNFDDTVKFVSDIYGQRFDCGIGFGPTRLDPNSPSSTKLRIQVAHHFFDTMDYETDQTLNA
tara:strand:- start:323 stop:727 length:405 start_codon:yes stop_codon:yes gene_type:complete